MEEVESDKIEIIELDLTTSKDYLKNVVYPYFIDIYNDLWQRSDDQEKGVDKVTMLEYSNLPGIVGERFFHLFDTNKDGYVDKKEFVKGFSRIFSSHLDTSLHLIFEFYDFDEDCFISQEDIRIILSYVPICEMANKERQREGKFTSGIGAETSFSDRKQAQEEIKLLLDQIFKDKDKIDFDDFKKFNQEVTSEALLWILNTLRNSLPWTNNFYLYLRNYQKVLEKGSKASAPSEKNSELHATPKMKSSPLASPTLGKKFLATSLLVSEKIKKKQLDTQGISQVAQNPLLKYALGPRDAKDGTTSNETKVVKEGAGLKSALKLNEEKNKWKMEMAKLHEAEVNIDYNAVRMPNKKAKITITSEGTKKTEESKNTLSIGDDTPTNNMLMSPSGFLNGQRKIKRDAERICICGRMPIKDDGEECCPLCEKKDIKMEGYLLRKAKKKNKLKKEWFSLLGRELYYYRSK